MFEEFIGKKVQIISGPAGEHTEYGLELLDIDGSLIKVQDSSGDIRVINAASTNFSEIRLQK